MSTIRSFTPQQQKLLQQLGEVHPEQWLHDEVDYLKSEHTVEELNSRRTQLLEHRELLLGMQATLPPRNHLDEYVSTVLFESGQVHKTVLVSTESGAQHLDLLGDDIVVSIGVRYKSLERLLEIALECIGALDRHIASLRVSAALPPNVIAVIKSLPETSEADKASLLNALTNRKGTIELEAYDKMDVCIVLKRLQAMLQSAGIELTFDEKKQILIKYSGGEFYWVSAGTKGGKVRDQVENNAGAYTAKATPMIATWMKNLA